MADDIRAGDVVVCVDDRPLTRFGRTSVPCPWKVGQVAGRVVCESPCRSGVGFGQSYYGEPFIKKYRFRKIDAPKTELSERIRACRPIPAKEPA